MPAIFPQTDRHFPADQGLSGQTLAIADLARPSCVVPAPKNRCDTPGTSRPARLHHPARALHPGRTFSTDPAADVFSEPSTAQVETLVVESEITV